MIVIDGNLICAYMLGYTSGFTGNNICFPSYWVVQIKDLIKFNKGAHQIDTSFDFYADELEKHHPDFDCLLFEGERVEIGEWDKTYKRWSSHSYQRVGVIWIDGKFHSMDEDGNIAVRTIPNISNLASGKSLITEFLELDINDLLGRFEVEPFQNLMKKI